MIENGYLGFMLIFYLATIFWGLFISSWALKLENIMEREYKKKVSFGDMLGNTLFLGFASEPVPLKDIQRIVSNYDQAKKDIGYLLNFIHHYYIDPEIEYFSERNSILPFDKVIQRHEEIISRFLDSSNEEYFGSFSFYDDYKGRSYSKPIFRQENSWTTPIRLGKEAKERFVEGLHHSSLFVNKYEKLRTYRDNLF